MLTVRTAVPARLLAACLSLSALSLSTAPALAQTLELPAASPAAKVSQRVGVTDISLEYSSPAVAGRQIWGALVPWDKAWRTGANAATKITFSKEVKFGGKDVPAGTYALISIPSEKGWTVILNKNTSLSVGDGAYDAKDELVRVTATSSAIAPRERMIFAFSDTKDAGTSLDLEWEKVKVSVPIAVATEAHARANIDAALAPSWRPHANAARWLAENTKDFDKAMGHINASIGIQSTWYNNWIKSDILSRQGKTKDACGFAKTALTMGNKDPANFWYKDKVEQALKDWKCK
jgi:hypothetical protein